MAINNQFPWRDGLGLIVPSENRAIMFGGWNDDGAFSPNVSTNEIWETTDGGSTWNYIGVAPWFRRHSFGCDLLDGRYICVFGGDLFYNGIAPQDMWVFDIQSAYDLDDPLGWTELTSNWGSAGGARVIFASCLHKGELYMAGGQTDYSDTATMFTDIVKYNFSTNEFDFVANLPISYFSTGSLVSDGNSLYLIGGGRYRASGHDNLNTFVFKSTNNGSTWSNIGSVLSEMNGLMYCNCTYWQGRIWFRNGYNLENQPDLFISPNGVDWGKNFSAPRTHASGISGYGANLYLVSGNENNSVMKVSYQ